MLFKIISYIPAVLGLLTIGFITLLKNTRDELSMRFFLLVLALAAWLLALFLGDLTISREFSLWSIRAAASVGTLIIPGFLYFSVDFPVRLRQPSRLFHVITLGSAAFFVVLALTPYMIPGVQLQPQSAQPTGLGLLYTLQTSYAAIGALTGVVIIFKKFRKVEARERAQIRLVGIGFLVAAVINVITGFVLAVTKQADKYTNLAGGLSFVAFVGATSYAIVRHRLFDIRLAITRTIGFITTIGLVAALYSVLILGIGVPLVTQGKLGFIKHNLQLLWFIPPTIFVALTFHNLQQWIARLTERVFYQDSYDTRAVLDKLSDTLISDSDINKIMAASLKVINQAIKPSHALFFVLDDKGDIYRQKTVNRSVPKQLTSLIDEARRLKKRILVKDELPFSQRPKQLENEDIALLLNLGLDKDLIGVLCFGPKQNGRMYTQQDIDLLNVSSKNLGVAIENAKKYEQIAKFAETMQQEVLQATSNLRHANSELKTLDSLKDDFISMASHQLRSPATSVHEAIQMLSQTDLTRSERQRLLELAEASSERLVGVITDMLSIARIQAGHFDVEKTYLDMAELADRAILEASGMAKQAKITVQFNRPDQPINLYADRSKLNESMSNYIENAIRYSSPDSKVVIGLRLEDNRACFEVSDSGIGVPLNERKNLFSKFYRASNARSEHPNGNGIGLFVVKTVAKSHGGDAYYKPLESGSLFGFWIPLK